MSTTSRLASRMLLIKFVDVSAESWNPNYLGRASRTAFPLPHAGVVIEVKEDPTLLVSKVGSELAEDITRHSDPAANRGVTTLVGLAHVPCYLRINPIGFERDLAHATNDRHKVIGVVG